MGHCQVTMYDAEAVVRRLARRRTMHACLHECLLGCTVSLKASYQKKQVNNEMSTYHNKCPAFKFAGLAHLWHERWARRALFLTTEVLT
jgi:hypothetical protein